MNKNGRSFIHKIKSYKLTSNILVMIILLISVIISVAIYFLPVKWIEIPELALAVATSMLASLITLISDTYVKYKSHENDTFLESIEELGIADLHFDKEDLLVDKISDCKSELWVSGYRLILTSDITKKLKALRSNNLRIRILITPPWEEAFKLVYGENQRVIDNYITIFDAIIKSNEDVKNQCEVRFTCKPLFNDTYYIDGHIITSPYMHNRDDMEFRITAKDFFTYELHNESRLYKMIKEEYTDIWDEAGHELDWDKYKEIRPQFENIKIAEDERISLLQEALNPIN